MTTIPWCPPDKKMCCICFECIPIADLWTDESGTTWDICKPCQALEDHRALERSKGNP